MLIGSSNFMKQRQNHPDHVKHIHLNDVGSAVPTRDFRCAPLSCQISVQLTKSPTLSVTPADLTQQLHD